MNPKLIASAKENKTKVDKPAIRFIINLGESNENTCPEISYRDIYKESIKKKKQSIDSNELSDLDILQKEDEKNEDERITAIVKNLEARYGVQGGKGKCKKMRSKIADLMDMGIGYDESDSFIDNSEAYDELVPSTMTTKLGGFYINSGLLEYKEIRSSSDDEKSLDHHNPHNKHHNPLSAHTHSKQARAGINRKSGTINNGRSLLKKSLSLSAVKSHKNLNNSNRSRHYLSLAKHNKKQFKKSVVDGKVKYLVTTPSESLQAFESTGQTEEKFMGRSKLDFVVENSQPALEENRNDRNSPKIAPPSQPSDPTYLSSVKKLSKKLNKSAMHLANCQSPTAHNSEITPETNTDHKAPNSQGKESKVVPALNLPPEIKELMDELIELGKPKSDRSASRYFTPRVNSILLRIENLTRKTMTFGQRSRLYHMLTGQLPCTRDTLVKKAKRIWLEDRQTKMDLTLGLFKKALSNAYSKTTLVLHKDDMENYKESAMKYLKQVIFLRLECLDRHKMSQVPLSGNSLNMVDESLKLYVKQEIDSIRSTLNINVDEQFTKCLLDMVRIVIGSYFAHSYHAKFHKYPPSTLPILPCSTVDGDNSAKNSSVEIYTKSPITAAQSLERLERVNSAFPSTTTNTSSQSMEPLAKRKIRPTPITPYPSSSATSHHVNNSFHNGPRHKSLTPPRDVKERLNASKVKPTASREVINNVQRGNVIALSPSPPPAKKQDCRSTPCPVATTSSPNQPRPDATWLKDNVSESDTNIAPLPNNEKASPSFPYTSIHPGILFPHAPSSHPLFKHYLPPTMITPPQAVFPFQPGVGKMGNPNHDELSSFIYNAIQKELHKGSPAQAAGHSSRKQQLSHNNDAHLIPGFLHPFSLTNILSQQSLPVQPTHSSQNIPSSSSCIVLPKTSPLVPNKVAKSDGGDPSSNNNEHYLITLDDE